MLQIRNKSFKTWQFSKPKYCNNCSEIQCINILVVVRFFSGQFKNSRDPIRITKNPAYNIEIQHVLMYAYSCFFTSELILYITYRSTCTCFLYSFLLCSLLICSSSVFFSGYLSYFQYLQTRHTILITNKISNLLLINYIHLHKIYLKTEIYEL